MPFGLGFFATAGVSAAGGTYELIASEILTGSQASVTFSNLGSYSSTYKHLQLRMVVRQNHTSNDADLILLRFNSDSGSNYATHRLWGNGSSVASYASSSATSLFAGLITRSTGSVNAASVADILDAYGTKNKTVRTLAGETNSSQNTMTLMSGLWNSTASLTSITLLPADATYNFAQYSRFSLYGIKG